MRIRYICCSTLVKNEIVATHMRPMFQLYENVNNIYSSIHRKLSQKNDHKLVLIRILAMKINMYGKTRLFFLRLSAERDGVQLTPTKPAGDT